MSTQRRTSVAQTRNFYNFSGNKRKWFSRNSCSMPKDKNFVKKNKIGFQLIEQEKVEINPNFYMPPQIVTLIKKNNAIYNGSSKAYQIPFKNYSILYKEIEKLINSEEYKKIIEFKNIVLEPIPLLPLEVASKAKDLQIMKFRQTITQSNNKKSTTQVTLDFSKDESKSLDSLPNQFLSTLYEFQKDGINFGIQRKGRFLLADEMGVGKSIQAIGVSLLFKENWPVLIICPSSLKLVWRDEIEKWIPEINKDKINIQVFKSSKDQFKNGEKFYIMSYDLSVKLEQKIKDKNFNFIIADEAHYLKSQDAKRTKCLIPIIQKSKRVLLLTGTPILSKPVELYPLLTMIRPDLFHNFKIYGNRYCDPKANFFGVDWTGSSCAKELNYILKNIMIRRLKKDVISQLPPKKRQKIEIQTDPKIVKQISAISINSEALFKKLEEINNNPLNLKLNLDNEEGEGKENINNLFNKLYILSAEAKANGVKEYIRYLIDNRCKFLIFAHHKVMLDAIEDEVKKLKIDYIRIDGKIKVEKRQEFVNKFQKDETCLVAILSITACYTGITLTAASTVVFSELHMTPAVMIQAEDRAHRIGQEHQCVNIHYLYGPDTLDEILFRMLNEKQNIFSNTVDNKSANMDVRYTFKKVGDFEKGKSDLELDINNKKVIVTNSGSKNMTLNGFVTFKNKYNNNLEKTEINEELKNVNLHKTNDRRNREYTPSKYTDDEDDNDDELEIESNNNLNININNDYDSITKNLFGKSKNDFNTNESINKPTKDKVNIKKKKGSNKNNEKISINPISNYFHKY